MGKRENQKLANDLRDFIVKHGIIDTRIYFNNKCYDWCGNSFENPTEYRTLENIKPTQYFEYGNDDTVSMSFEGELYEIINNEAFQPEVRPMLAEFNAIFEKHNCYYELGHSWNLAVYFL